MVSIRLFVTDVYANIKTVKLPQTVGAPDDIMHFVKTPTPSIDASLGHDKAIGGKVPRPFFNAVNKCIICKPLSSFIIILVLNGDVHSKDSQAGRPLVRPEAAKHSLNYNAGCVVFNVE